MPKKIIRSAGHLGSLLSLMLASQLGHGQWAPPVPGQIHNQGPVVIRNVRVFDGIHSHLIENATVLIDYIRMPDTQSGTGETILGYDVGYFIREVAQGKPLKTPYDAGKAREIDGQNKVLMPGLIDTHVHLSWANVTHLINFATKLNEPGSGLTFRDWQVDDKRDPADPSFIPNAIHATKQEAAANLMRGFTSVREVGGIAAKVRRDLNPHETLIDPTNKKGPKQLVLSEPGPRIWAAGAVISSTAGHADGQTELASRFHLFKDPDVMTAIEREDLILQLDQFGLRTADGVAGVQKAVRDQFVKDVDLIKITTGGGILSPHDPIDATTFSGDEVSAAVQVAQGYNTYVTTHAYNGDTIIRDISRGVRMIEHADLLTDAAARMVKRKESKKDADGRNIGPWLGISAFFDNEYADQQEGPKIDKQKQVQEGALKAYALAKKYKLKHVGWGSDVMFQMTGGTNTPKIIAHLPVDLAPLKHWKNDKGKLNPLNLRKTGNLRLARGPGFGSIFTVDS